MKRNKILYTFIILLFISLIGLGVNIKNYNNQIKLKDKYIKDKENIKNEISSNQTKLEQVKNQYNTLLEEEKEKIEVYESWKEKNEEIKEYLK